MKKKKVKPIGKAKVKENPKDHGGKEMVKVFDQKVRTKENIAKEKENITIKEKADQNGDFLCKSNQQNPNQIIMTLTNPIKQ